MNALGSLVFSLLAIAALIALAWLGVGAIGLDMVFGVIIPYLAILVFLVGFVYRIVKWAQSPVPFRIPTTCGQQKSLDWIKHDTIENPSSGKGAFLRMVLEVLFFRSLFRNTKAELHNEDGTRLVYGSNKWLWAAGLAFHYTFLLIFVRHLRFFAEPVPGFIQLAESLDSFAQIGVPILYLSDLGLLAAVTYLFLRRVVSPQLRYISLPADYFPLFLIFAIGVTGVMMRYFTKVDLVGVKELAMGLLTFSPTVPEGIGSLFYIHLFLVCALFMYFPFSKLMHLGGVFLSPTRNLSNNNRAVRHVNPWNHPVKTHDYHEWEEENRDLLKAAEIPLDNEEWHE